MTRSAHLLCSLSTLSFLALAACADPAGSGADEALDLPGDRVAVVAAGSYEERIVLDLVNTAAETTLDVDAGLDSRAAANIVDHRTGPDGLDGTADDAPFDTWAELDAISYVGATALDLLLDYALALYGPEVAEEPTVLVYGIAEGSPAAVAMLVLANSLSQVDLDDAVGLDSRAARNIVAARESAAIATLTDLDGISYVGASAFDQLYAYGLATGHIREGGCSDGLVWIAGGGEYASPGTAARAAADGDIVYVCAGSWTEQVTIDTAIQLVGLEGAADTVIDADATGSTLTVNVAGATVSGVTLTGGRGAGSGSMTGGGVHVDSGADGFVLRDAIVSGNTAHAGGGLALEADVTLERVTVSENSASGDYGYGGGIVVYQAVLTGVDLVVSDNVAERGGGLYLYHSGSEVELDGGEISRNESTDGYGGGVFASGPMQLTDTLLDANVSDRGAAVYLLGDTTVTLHGAVLTRNVAGSGNGAFALSRGTLLSVDADWGSGVQDNNPSDLVGFDSGWSALTATASFRCQATSTAVSCSY